MSFIARFARCRLVLGALLVVAGSLLLGGCGSGGGRVYRDRASGLQLNYPAGFRALSFDYGIDFLGGASSGMIVVNRPGRAVLSSGGPPVLFVWSDLKPNAVVFMLSSEPRYRQIYGRTIDAFATPGLSEASEITARLPLNTALFRSLKQENFMDSAYWQALGLQIKGRIFAADVYIGPRASEADRGAIWRVVTSLRFPS
jgi:hypothetical protein